MMLRFTQKKLLLACGMEGHGETAAYAQATPPVKLLLDSAPHQPLQETGHGQVLTSFPSGRGDLSCP